MIDLHISKKEVRSQLRHTLQVMMYNSGISVVFSLTFSNSNSIINTVFLNLKEDYLKMTHSMRLRFPTLNQ
ncbi:erythromycin resistance leader peptide [Bacillus sp. PAMC26568]|nr:erythromycin resistance leader peptide [Bacillus sp. PAMC26568]